MPQPSPAKILRLHFSEDAKYQGKPLYEAIIERCRNMKIAGATVFRGLEGYGETAEVHRHHLVTHDQPIIVVIVDSAENIDRLTPVVEEMLCTGMIAVSDVDMIRVQKNRPPQNV
jgi:PII-like signaling protein